jgi:hypothetical protein
MKEPCKAGNGSKDDPFTFDFCRSNHFKKITPNTKSTYNFRL